MNNHSINPFQGFKIAKLGASLSTASDVRTKVLVTDDSKAISNFLGTCIQALGYVEPIQSGNLREVKAILSKYANEFMCAVLDLNLPDAPDGEVVDYVRSHNIPVIVLTGSVDNALREKMLSKQVIDYVIKGNTHEIEHVAYVVGRLYANQSIKILVVDDSKAFRDYLEGLLKHYCYQTLSAPDAESALKILEKNPDITLIITDFYMPGMNGQELVQRLRSQYRREELAVIGLSDATHSGLSAMLLKSGANDFLHKPFEVEEFYCRVTQNTNMISYVRQIKDTATRDFLTNTYNRRYLFDVGTTLHANAQRGHIRLAAAIIDADYFKKINDTYGHQVGDLALKAISQTLNTQLRKSDIVARFGGEEFVCLVVLRTAEDAAQVFEKLRKKIESIEIKAQEHTVTLTCSIGVTLSLENDLDAMLKIADDAVYRAKQQGRNRVVII